MAGRPGPAGLIVHHRVILEFRREIGSAALLLLCTEVWDVPGRTYRHVTVTFSRALVNTHTNTHSSSDVSSVSCVLCHRCVSRRDEFPVKGAVSGSGWCVSSGLSGCHDGRRVCYGVLRWMLLFVRSLSVQQHVCSSGAMPVLS